MPAKGPLPSSRPPIARMLRIHEELQDGHLTNCSKLARKLEVSTKTIMRDLAFMRDQLDLPVEYDSQTYSWRYSYPVRSFPTVQVSEGELLALLVAQKALEQYKGTPYHDQLAHAFEKLSAGLHDRVSFSASSSLGSVSFHHLGLSKADLKDFASLSRAVMQCLEIEFDYTKPNTKAERRRVQPYHLANRDNSWYLVGYDLNRKDLRNFAVVRMQAVTVTTKKFEKPKDFSPEKHFGKSFGAYVGKGDHKVVVRFNAEVTGLIKERVWHETLETKDLPDGRLEFTLRLDSLDEIQRWILGWGPMAEVMEPKELIEGVRHTGAALGKLYPA
jgi:predicted DNA-binding transcriptional regulator YafY